MKLWFDQHPACIDTRTDLLHFAPESGSIAPFLRQRTRYRSADIEPGRADLVLNIERIDLSSESFDLIVCSDVLEHVDDRTALAEMFRILRPKGVVLLMTPVIEGWQTTYENPSIRSPDERMLHYGQWDHVRYYGSDLRERIASAGFKIEEFTAEGEVVVKLGLLRGQKIFVSRRP